MTRNERLAGVGAKMWMFLAEEFYGVADDESATDKEGITALWAGFVAASAGSVVASIGPDVVSMVLDQVKAAASAKMQSEIKAAD